MRQAASFIWTRHEVETRLVAAFRAMPSHPVFGRPSRLRPVDESGATGAALGALGWASLVDDDPAARVILWAWARCRATGESFAALCRAMGWKRPTAEVARRRAAAAIAAALNRATGDTISDTPGHTWPDPVDK